jgi:molybdopterin molybdotransferase
MVPLSGDCFAHGGALVTVDEALEQIERRLEPVVEAENVPFMSDQLLAAAGRVLAQDLVAGMDLPPHANSAVDGYAVVHSDPFPDRETVLSVRGRTAAGQSLGRPVCRGEAIRIFTGAPIPEGADTLIMQEDCVAIDGSDGGQVRVKPGTKKCANHRQAGEDVSAGAVALRAGRRLFPADLGLGAALGRDPLPVFRPLRVALLSTGNEICAPGRALPPATIYDANRVMLAALLERLGCVVSDLGIQADCAAMLVDTFACTAIDQDLIVTSGGVSTGEEDDVRNAIEQLGSLHFWRLATGKTGRPGPDRRRPTDWVAWQPGGRFRDICDDCETADPKASRRSAGVTETISGTCWFRPPQEAGAPRVPARQPRSRERPSCHEISPRRLSNLVVDRAI